MRSVLSVLLCLLLTVPLRSAQEKQPTLQETIGAIATGSIIEAKTRIKEMKTVRGRLGAVTSEGFSVQVAKGASVDTVTLKYEDVKKVSLKSETGKRHTALWILAGVGIGVGVLIAVFAIIYAASY